MSGHGKTAPPPGIILVVYNHALQEPVIIFPPSAFACAIIMLNFVHRDD